MICDICKKNKPATVWHSSGDGTIAVCPACGDGLNSDLNELAEYGTDCESLDSLLREILRVAQKITQADMGNIQLLDGQGVLRIRAQNGFSKEFLEFFSGVAEKEAACGSALTNRKTVVVEDVARSPVFAGKPSLKIMLDAGARAVQSTPVFGHNGHLIGIFSTHYHAARRLSEHEVRLLQFLAREAAVLIEAIAVSQR